MWKLIITNLWSRRKRNGWLLAELVLVSVVTWVILDPVIVILYDCSLPTGYDEDRLCLVDVARLDERASQYDAEANDSADFFRLIDKVRALPEVENVAPIFSFAYMESQGNMSRGFQADTLHTIYAGVVNFAPGQRYFETYGLRSVPGSPSPEELSAMTYGGRDVVVTRSLANALFPDGDVLGKWRNDATISLEGEEGYHIVGIVEDVRAYTTRRESKLAFFVDEEMDNRLILIRQKNGITPNRFLHDFRPWMVKELRSGNLYGRTVTAYTQIIRDYEYQAGATNSIRLNMALAAFFLVNLCLGVIGTFWLQTRKRSEEAGVMRSFGATPSGIVRMLLGEGAVLCTVAFLLGCFAYFQYAVKEGLSNGANWREVMTDDWVSHFSTHFMGVSLIVYVILLVVVSIGIYIPARGISRVNPVDALRDE